MVFRHSKQWAQPAIMSFSIPGTVNFTSYLIIGLSYQITTSHMYMVIPQCCFVIL